MKKTLSFFLCLCLCFTFFVGCANQSPTADNTVKTSDSESEGSTAVSEEEAVAAAPYTGEKSDVLVWLYAADDMEHYADHSFYERIQDALPQYNVIVEIITGTGEDMENKYEEAKAKGIVPDAMYIILSSFGKFGNKDEWLVLDPYMEGWEGMDDIMSASLSMGKLAGSYVGIGATPAPVVLAYRTDYFEEAGLDPLKPPTNWKELEEYALLLTKKTSDGSLLQAGLDLPTTDNYGNFSFPFMRMNGAVIVNERASEPVFTDSKVIETLEYLKRLSDYHISFSYNWQDAKNIPFLKGKSAMSFINLDLYVHLLKDNPELVGKTQVALPLGNEMITSFCGYRVMTIPKASKNPDGGWEVIKFIMSKEEMQYRVENMGVIPVRKSLMEIYEALNPEIGRSVMETVSVGKGAFLVPWVSAMYQHYGPAYEAIIQGEKTPAEAMEEVQNGILSEIGN